MSFTQLEPYLPLHVVDRGKGVAVAVIDYGPEFDLLWVVAMDDGGEIWCVPNPQVRMQANWSMGRRAAPATGSGKIAKLPVAATV
ncbi:hypothetical protein GCM10022281_17680 [Sphingomonas rosea]|uniref:Uncharacterized protein n=1 Tax=Sphingomonas rosea TaxID=335605 RepID=A0ABP7U7P0_9SPHN